MIFRALRKGQKWILAVLVFLIVVTVSIREYDLLPDEWYFGQYLQDTVPHWDSTSSTPLPRKIWQIFSARADAQEQPRDSIDPKALGDTTSWIGLNPGYQYTLLGAGTTSSDDFVIKHFSHEKSIIDTYFSLRNPGLKTDLLRYLILWVEGGVYADLDTWAIKPIDAWVPEQLRSGGKVRAVVGLEWDQLDGEPWPGPGGEPSWATHVVQFCQWTLAAVPGHPLFENAVETALERISDLAAAKKTPISDLDPTGYEVVTTTGPSAWTDVVFQQLRKADPMFQSLKELSGMKESRLIGDILVLDIDGFGMGQPHSNSTADGSIPDTALAKHGFRHSWVQ